MVTETETRKLTISLPKNLVTFADKMAKEKNVSRSKIVSMCLEYQRRKQKTELMKEGYLAMANEHSEFALLAEDSAKEIISAQK